MEPCERCSVTFQPCERCRELTARTEQLERDLLTAFERIAVCAEIIGRRAERDQADAMEILRNIR